MSAGNDTHELFLYNNGNYSHQGDCSRILQGNELQQLMQKPIVFGIRYNHENKAA